MAEQTGFDPHRFSVLLDEEERLLRASGAYRFVDEIRIVASNPDGRNAEDASRRATPVDQVGQAIP